MMIRVSEATAPTLLDAIANQLAKLEQIRNRMPDEERAYRELSSAADKLRTALR